MKINTIKLIALVLMLKCNNLMSMENTNEPSIKFYSLDHLLIKNNDQTPLKAPNKNLTPHSSVTENNRLKILAEIKEVIDSYFENKKKPMVTFQEIKMELQSMKYVTEDNKERQEALEIILKSNRPIKKLAHLKPKYLQLNNTQENKDHKQHKLIKWKKKD